MKSKTNTAWAFLMVVGIGASLLVFPPLNAGADVKAPQKPTIATTIIPGDQAYGTPMEKGKGKGLGYLKSFKEHDIKKIKAKKVKKIK